MTEQEEYKTNQESVKDGYRKQFDEYLNGKDFSFEALKDFCENVLFIKLLKEHQEQTNIKLFLDSYAPQLSDKYGEEEATSKLKSLYKLFPNSHVKTWNEFKNSIINFDDSKDYHSNIFINRRFPVGTISYIGARPGRGKTTVLINIALDALHQGKPVVFATAEETTKQILTRFILAESYKNNEHNPKIEYESFNSQTRTLLFNYIKDFSNSLPGVEINNGDIFEEAFNTIQNYIDSKQLIIFESYGATWNELTDFLAEQDAGTLILIDYIQHLKTPADIATQTRQVQIQEISHQLADLAGVHNLIMISGAQFNRDTRNGNGKPDLEKADTFDETSFREAGDIEQDGHILIGIGKDPRPDQLFYSCMKDREKSPDNGKYWKLKKDFAYSFLQGDKDKDGAPVQYFIYDDKPGKEKKNPGESKEQSKKTPKSFNDLVNGAY